MLHDNDYVASCTVKSAADLYAVGSLFASSFIAPSLFHKNSAFQKTIGVALIGPRGSGKSTFSKGCIKGLTGNGGPKNTAAHINLQMSDNKIVVKNDDLWFITLDSIEALAEGSPYRNIAKLKQAGKQIPNPFYETNSVRLVEHPSIPHLFTSEIFAITGNPDSWLFSANYFKGVRYYLASASNHSKGTLTQETFKELDVAWAPQFEEAAKNLVTRVIPEIRNAEAQVNEMLPEIKEQHLLGESNLRIIRFVLTSEAPIKREAFAVFKENLTKLSFG